MTANTQGHCVRMFIKSQRNGLDVAMFNHVENYIITKCSSNKIVQYVWTLYFSATAVAVFCSYL